MTPELGSIAGGAAVGVGGQMIVAASAAERTDQMVSVRQFVVPFQGQRRRIGLHLDLVLEQDPEYGKSVTNNISVKYICQDALFAYIS